MDPIISICIPTWNRAKYLEECLDSIVCQFSDERLCNQVEIVISNNASDDNTEEVVKKYQQKFNNIYYNRNETNIGFGRNVAKVIDCAHGKYVWLFGDDDVMVSNGLKLVFRKIVDKNYSAILLNFYHGEYSNPRLKIYKNFVYYKDKEYNNSKLFFKGKDSSNLHGMGFISVIIFDRNLYHKNKHTISSYLDNYYYQVYAFLVTVLEGPALRIAKALVGYRRTFTKKIDDGKVPAMSPEVAATIKKQSYDFIKYTQQLGYELDDNFKDGVYMSARNYPHDFFAKVISFLTTYHLLKFARIFYRIPRLLRYYFSRIKSLINKK